jgi:short-subunit dehydrogenase
MNNGKHGYAFITGASSGIGAAFARRLARDGHHLILHGRRKELLVGLCGELRREFGVRTEYLLAELSDPAELRSVEEQLRGIEDLEMLVNNAGYASVRRFREEDIDGQEDIIRVHVIATVRLTHAALPGMLRRGKGSIINVSSVAAFMISPNSTTYCATKLYLNSFTESMHLELRGTGVRVQVLCPGFTISDFHKKLGYDTSGTFFRSFMSAEKVVDTSLRALKRGKVVCIPGLKYKIAAFVPRIIPRSLMYFLAIAYGRRTRAVREP